MKNNKEEVLSIAALLFFLNERYVLLRDVHIRRRRFRSFLVRYERGDRVKVLPFPLAMESFEEWLQLRQLSEETIRGYMIDMRQFYEWRSLRWNAPVDACAIESRHFDGYLHYLMTARACQPRSVNRKLNALSTFFECLILKEWITSNPVDRVSRMKVVEEERIYLTGDEVERLLANVEHPVIYYFLRTMAFTGIRVSECIDLTLTHINLDDQTLLVEKGKGGKTRRVPLNDEITADLSHYTRSSARVDVEFVRVSSDRSSEPSFGQYAFETCSETSEHS